MTDPSALDASLAEMRHRTRAAQEKQEAEEAARRERLRCWKNVKDAISVYEDKYLACFDEVGPSSGRWGAADLDRHVRELAEALVNVIRRLQEAGAPHRLDRGTEDDYAWVVLQAIRQDPQEERAAQLLRDFLGQKELWSVLTDMHLLLNGVAETVRREAGAAEAPADAPVNGGDVATDAEAPPEPGEGRDASARVSPSATSPFRAPCLNPDRY
jgi:hypothetical protein